MMRMSRATDSGNYARNSECRLAVSREPADRSDETEAVGQQETVSRVVPGASSTAASSTASVTEASVTAASVTAAGDTAASSTASDTDAGDTDAGDTDAGDTAASGTASDAEAGDTEAREWRDRVGLASCSQREGRAERDVAWVVEVASGSERQRKLVSLGERLVIGRSSEATLRVEDASVSGLHCCLEVSKQGLNVSDLRSSSGVWMGGVRVQKALLTCAASVLLVGSIRVLVRSVAEERRLDAPVPGLIGSSAPMRDLYRDIRSFAPHNVSVLIQGETGTGKDVVARALHDLSGRRGEFVVLNAGAMTESLADAELFGHRKGAFTGAFADRKGAFELASGGTLFLDEVADLSPAIQVKLLRALEAKCVRPLGSNREVTVDVRVVSASWASLEERVARGRFRVDLLHRLSTAFLRVEPLRRRRSDIKDLAQHLLELGEPEFGPQRLTDDAVARLMRYTWPGNVRQLKSVLSRASMRSHHGTISALDIEAALPTEVRKVQREVVTPNKARELVAVHRGNISAAARAVGLPRTTFRSLLDKPPALSA